jgi:hypothetical protein
MMQRKDFVNQARANVPSRMGDNPNLSQQTRTRDIGILAAVVGANGGLRGIEVDQVRPGRAGVVTTSNEVLHFCRYSNGRYRILEPLRGLAAAKSRVRRNFHSGVCDHLASRHTPWE